MNSCGRSISSIACSALAACFVLFIADHAQAAIISVPAGGDLQAALNNAQPGDTIVLEPGATYVGNFILPSKGGSSFITVSTSPAGLPGDGARISPAHAASLAKLRSPSNGGSAVQTAPGAHHWRLVLLEFLSADGAGDIITLGDGSSAQSSLSPVPHDLVVDRCYIHGEPGLPQKRGIALNSASTTVTGSYIADIKAVGQDSQAICGWNGPGPFTITNNYLEAAGENIMFGGADPSIPNLVPSDITIANNAIAKQLAWRSSAWSVKNLLELKNARRVSIQGNTFDYNWQAAQSGFAILFTVRNQDGACPWCQVEQVTFANNVLRHSGSGINILGSDDILNRPSLRTNHITIFNNLFVDLDGQNWGGNGYFLQLVNGPQDVTVDHNTIIQDHSFGILNLDLAPAPRFTFTNNLARHSQYGIIGSGYGPGTGTIAFYLSDSSIVKNVIADADPNKYPAGNIYPTSAAFRAQFVSYDAGNYKLVGNSPWRRAGTDGLDLGAILGAVRPSVAADMDGDRKADLTIFRPSSGTWLIRNSATAYTTNSVRPWGLAGDVPVPGDYDGDGVGDLAVYRPLAGTWYVLRSSTNYTAGAAYSLGVGTDIPVPGDYDGDGKTDPAVYRPSTGFWYVLTTSSNFATTAIVVLGLSTDIPVPADYDGDGLTDVAVYRPSTGVWIIRTSSSQYATTLTFQWGLNGDVPVPGDYDGDGISDIAVYRPAIGMWFIRQSTTSFTTSASFRWGLSTDIAVPADYDGDGKADLAVFRPATGTWYISQSTTNDTTSVSFQWGLSADSPTPNGPIAYAMAAAASRGAVSARANLARASDLDGDGRSDLTVYRPSTGTWFTLRSSGNYATTAVFTLGVSTDLPVTGDFDGDGKTDVAVFTPATGTWSILRSSSGIIQYQWGLNGDVPVPGDYDGDGRPDVAVYRAASGTWYIRQSSSNFTAFVTFQWGLMGDVPVPGDYDGDGVTDLAAYRPSTGEWFIRLSTTAYVTSATFQWGIAGDVTVPGDYDGDGKTDVAIYRPSTGVWYIRQSSANYSTSAAFQWGVTGDVAVPGDYDGDGKTDVAVYRPSTGVWLVLRSSTSFTTSASYQWGAIGDVPILKRP
jgi:FG-GAP-like repeat